MELFGFEFKKKVQPDLQPSFSPKETDDGALVIAAGGSFGTYVDLDGTVRTEAELVTKYREMALQPECDAAIDEIVNETMAIDEKEIVKIDLDQLDISSNIKKIIQKEFDNCLNILDFNRHAYEIYRRWYVDGRLYYHVIIDQDDTKAGIKEVRFIDPRKIRKVREVAKKRTRGGQTNEAVIQKTQNEYYIYNDKGFNYGNKTVGPTTTGLKIAKDTILHCTSGLTDTNGTMVLSYLHKAIKPLNQLRTLEDALVIYRLARAPERRIWYIDVGNLPKMKAEQYVRDIMVKHKNRLIYDAESGNIRDDRKFMCFALDTKIPLLDGRTLTLQELIDEYQLGIKNWVYSCDPVTGKFVPGPVSWAGITKRNSDVVRVTFDNGKSVVCTPDHKFPVWGKGFIEAQNLAVGESIIPGYRRMKEITSGGVEYEQIFKNDTKTWEFTHREVAKWKDDNGIREEYTYKDSNQKKTIVYHVDYNRFNNSPNNLIMMGHKDHLDFHRENQNIDYTKEIYDIVEYCAKNMMSLKNALIYINENIDVNEWKPLNELKHIKNRSIDTLAFTYKDLIRICIQCDHKDWKRYRRRYDYRLREKSGRISRSVHQVTKGSVEWKNILSASAKNRNPIAKTWKISNPNGTQEIIENLSAYCRDNGLNRSNIKTNYGSKGYYAEQLHNHKVVSVEFLDEKIDTGCITVDLEETYHSNHTYLLDAGVYTKNTMLEDYWLPRRDGGKGTEVTTLPGGQTLGQMDDVLYFQKKFYQTLNVPVNRLNSDALFSLGRATEVTRDELKFSRFISRLRGKFATLFVKMLEKQLVLKQIMSLEDFNNIAANIKFNFSKDNYFTELKDGEILENRINLARNFQDMAGKYYSHQWIRKNILQQTDEDIEDMDEEIEEENDSDDPRWINPSIMQNEMEEQQEGETEIQPLADDEDTDATPETDEKNKKIQRAKADYDILKDKKNRTLADEAKFKSASQVLAKNK